MRFSAIFGTMTWTVTLPTLVRSLAVVIERPIYQRAQLRAPLRAACFNSIYLIVLLLATPQLAMYSPRTLIAIRRARDINFVLRAPFDL